MTRYHNFTRNQQFTRAERTGYSFGIRKMCFICVTLIYTHLAMSMPKFGLAQEGLPKWARKYSRTVDQLSGPLYWTLPNGSVGQAVPMLDFLGRYRQRWWTSGQVFVGQCIRHCQMDQWNGQLARKYKFGCCSKWCPCSTSWVDTGNGGLVVGTRLAGCGLPQ